MKPRVTIKLRHTGRIYIGLSVEDFFTLMLGFKTGFPMHTPEDHLAGKDRITKAIDRFTADIKKETKS